MGNEPREVPVWVPVAIYVATMLQLAVAAFVPGIERFADKAFGARLLAYAVLMALVPAIWSSPLRALLGAPPGRLSVRPARVPVIAPAMPATPAPIPAVAPVPVYGPAFSS